MQNDVLNELGTNFIEYAVAVNTDRAIPDAKSGLKPVAKRILYGTYDQGFTSSKPHVKCANIVGNVMADWHPHGDSSIYGALVRMSQPWVMRYPLIDFHGSNGNIDGDGPAAYRYTESRLAKISEDGLLSGIRKGNVDFLPNYSETKDEPVTLPAIFPNLLCNPNAGIGVAMACSWAPHNLKEVANAIYSYMNGEEPMLPGPDFPTGGVIINKNDISAIMKTGHGSVKIRAKYHFEGDNIVFTEIPYGTGTEELMNQIGSVADSDISGIEAIRNESNKKGFRLVVECEKGAAMQTIINKLFSETDLQTTFSYNQVALIDKTPIELNLKQCIEVYVKHGCECIQREAMFDIKKAKDRLHIVNGLIKALDIIDEIIAMIKASESATVAKMTLINEYKFSEAQAQAILDMKLSKLARLEKEELEKEKKELEELIIKLEEIFNNPQTELRKRLATLVEKYGDDRRTELTQVEIKKEEKEIQYVEPEKCVVVMTESGLIKRVPAAAFKVQKRNGKGVKTTNDIVSNTIRTNTIDQLMIFTDKGNMYRLLVNDIPSGTNTTPGVPIKSLISMPSTENPTIIYSIYRDTDAQFVLFVTKNGMIKKTTLEEYAQTKKKSGLSAITLKEGDELASVNLVKDEPIIIVTKNGMCIRINSTEVTPTSRATSGVKGMGLNLNDEVITAWPVRHSDDCLAIFSRNGLAKKVNLSEFPIQKRGGKGLYASKPTSASGDIVGAALISDEDTILVIGNKSSICISAVDIPLQGRVAVGNQIIKNSNITSISKV